MDLQVPTDLLWSPASYMQHRAWLRSAGRNLFIFHFHNPKFTWHASLDAQHKQGHL
jgi:hypothetical protein